MQSRSRWQDGRRAWQRLNGWHNEPDGSPGHPTTEKAALDALEDVALVRTLLGRAEVNAVSTARETGASWAQIGAALGISKQSAWERFSDPGSSASD